MDWPTELTVPEARWPWLHEAHVPRQTTSYLSEEHQDHEKADPDPQNDDKISRDVVDECTEEEVHKRKDEDKAAVPAMQECAVSLGPFDEVHEGAEAELEAHERQDGHAHLGVEGGSQGAKVWVARSSFRDARETDRADGVGGYQLPSILPAT